MENCKHEIFDADVNVNRIENERKNILDFVAELKIKCRDCGMPFQFHGIRQGLDFNRPTIDFTGHELRLPISPSNGTLKLPSRSKGFSMEVIHDH